MKKLARKQSKRISTRQRVKSEKKIRDYNRKIRKEKKKNPGKFAKSKKDPGVPNMCPFKEKVLQEVEEARQRKVEEKQKRREQMKQIRKDSRDKAVEEKRASGFDVSDKDAFKKLHELEKTLKIERELKQRMTDRSAKAFFREFGKMVETSDVIIQVLDARDPMGSRCREVETAVLAASKKLVLVLSKADLVPRENIEAWVKYLRLEFPTFVVKSSTQSSRVAHGKVVDKNVDANQKSVGVSTLMSVLSSFCVNKSVETQIRVGVVGLPNVGKASLVYSLKKARGIDSQTETDETKEVQLDPKIVLLTRPGTILASGLMTEPDVVLRNTVKVESMDDPVTPVKSILDRCPKESLMLHYKISDFADVKEFLGQVSLGMKKLKRGGTPSLPMAAKYVLNNWYSGKIRFFTQTPDQEQPRPDHVTPEVVEEHAKDFSCDKLAKLEQSDLEKLPMVLPSDVMLIKTFGMVGDASKEDDKKEEVQQEEESDDDSDDSEEMDVEEEEKVLKQMILAAKSRPGKKSEKGNLPMFKEEGLARQKKVVRFREKNEKKNGKVEGTKKKDFGKKKNGRKEGGNAKENVEIKKKEFGGTKKNAAAGATKGKKQTSTGDAYDFNNF